jgi:hypothetical protein
MLPHLIFVRFLKITRWEYGLAQFLDRTTLTVLNKAAVTTAAASRRGPRGTYLARPGLGQQGVVPSWLLAPTRATTLTLSPFPRLRADRLPGTRRDRGLSVRRRPPQVVQVQLLHGSRQLEKRGDVLSRVRKEQNVDCLLFTDLFLKSDRLF